MNSPCAPSPKTLLARFHLGLGLAVLCIFALSTVLWAQTTISGAIAGSVMDPSGAAIPNATVTVTNTGTGATTTLTTGAAGDYHAALLKPGGYTVTVAASGFQSGQKATSVAVGQTSTVDLTLTVAKGITTIQVQGTAIPLLQPENADMGTTISQEQVQNLPNPGGDITYYVNLTQGVVMNNQGGYGNSSAFGLPATSNNFTVNGAQDNDPFLNLNNSGPSNLLLGQNDIEQVNVVANAYSAQYGGLGAIQENIITRSGTNNFHGDINYYWTNSDLNANNWFNDNTAAPQPFSNANQWGAAVGGPVVRDKAFFFVNYEGMRFVTSAPAFTVIPSPAYQSSVLSNLSANGNAAEIPFYQHIFSLYNGSPGASRATPFATTPAGFTWADSYESNPKNNLTETLITARYDQKLGEHDNMWIHFKRDHGLQPTFVDPITPIFNADSDQPDYEGQLEETHSFSSNVVNQFLLSGMWYSALFVSSDPATAASTFPYTLGFGFGDGSFTDLGGEGFEWPQGRNVTQYQVNDDVSWTKGKHTISFGAIFKRNDVTDHDLGIFSTALGVETGPSAAPPNASGAIDPGDVFGNGSLLVGIQNFPLRPSAPIAVYNLGVYAQDAWKVTPSFQFNYGVRVEHNSNPVCEVNCFAHFGDSYTAVTAGLNTPYNSVLLSGLSNSFIKLQEFTIDPRIGFTFALPNHPNTLFRGGFGIFTDIFPATVADNLLSNAPLNPQFSAGGLADPSQPGSFEASLISVNNSFKTGYASGGSFNSISATNPLFVPPNVFNVDSKIHYPTYDEWSLQWQQQMGRHAALQVAYVGNRGYHEPVVNQGVNSAQTTLSPTYLSGFTPAPTSFGGLPANQALPAFGQVTEVQSRAVSNYNGLVSSVKFQSHIFTGMLNYTWSHALDEISNGGFLPVSNPSFANTIQPIDPFDLNLNYGNADYDIRHNLTGDYLITVPQWGHPAFLTGGWTIGGTVFRHSGFPFSVTSSAASSALNAFGAYGSGSAALADVTTTSVPHHCGKDVTTGCFGGDAATGTPSPDFADPTSFFGESHRNQFYGPGYFNTDFTLMKSFKIPRLERGKLEIGAQAYNVLNHPNFANPVFNYDNPAFGEVQRTVSDPTSVFGSFLGGDASPRIMQLRGTISF